MEYSDLINDYFAQFTNDATTAIKTAHEYYDIYRCSGGELSRDDWFFSDKNACLTFVSTADS